MPSLRRARNDPGQYDDLAGEWWRPGSPLSMLYWLARARARLIPPASRDGAVLVDLGCGGGLLAPHIAGKGYRHVGVDLIVSGLEQARSHGVAPVLADAGRLPLADASADVVSAGELLEHVPDVPAVIAEACRVLRPGGWLVVDTIADTVLARLVAVRLAEAVMPAVRGIRPGLPSLARWLVTRRNAVPIVPTFSTAILYQGRGRKEPL
jgi:2-polyprenyl-6-hydroxyphenyl methylase/3-demethylubiquinone-9 3-methyltransferase